MFIYYIILISHRPAPTWSPTAHLSAHLSAHPRCRCTTGTSQFEIQTVPSRERECRGIAILINLNIYYSIYLNFSVCILPNLPNPIIFLLCILVYFLFPMALAAVVQGMPSSRIATPVIQQDTSSLWVKDSFILTYRAIAKYST